MAKFSVEEGEGPSSPKKRRRAGGGEGEGDEEGSGGDEVETLGNEKMISVRIDPDVLDCSICLEPLLTPVFQCQNGHIACCSCWIKLKNKCHSCSLQIGSTRCLAVEKVIESIKIRCRNSRYGCKETLFYSRKSTHELCVHAPCRCPISDCKFIGSPKQLSLHFNSNHCVSPARFRYNCPVQVCLGKNEPLLFLQGEDGLLFLVNNRNEQMGNVVFLIAVERSSPKGGYAFDLVTRKGARSLQLQSFTGSNMKQPEVAPAPSADFLVVPSDFYSCHEQLNLEVCIKSTWERG